MKHTFDITVTTDKTYIYKNELSDTVLFKLTQLLNRHYQFVKEHSNDDRLKDLCHEESIKGLTILSIIARNLSQTVYDEYLNTFFHK